MSFLLMSSLCHANSRLRDCLRVIISGKQQFPLLMNEKGTMFIANYHLL